MPITLLNKCHVLSTDLFLIKEIVVFHIRFNNPSGLQDEIKLSTIFVCLAFEKQFVVI